jgi:hypothetical protein
VQVNKNTKIKMDELYSVFFISHQIQNKNQTKTMRKYRAKRIENKTNKKIKGNQEDEWSFIL